VLLVKVFFYRKIYLFVVSKLTVVALSCWGLSIKDIHNQGGCLVQAREEGGSSDADVCTFWCKKYRVFPNLWCVRTDKRN